MTFEEKLGLSNVNHQIICKFILYLICNDWKQILRSETLKNLLKTFCDKNKGTRKKSFQSFLTRKFASLFNLYIVNNSLLHDYQTNVWIKRKNMLMENHQNQKCYIYIYIYIHGILSPHEDGEEAIFQGQWGVCLFIWTVEGSFIWGIWGQSKLGVSLGELQYQLLAQLANFIKLSLLMSLHLCDNLIKFYFDKLGHIFIH